MFDHYEYNHMSTERKRLFAIFEKRINKLKCRNKETEDGLEAIETILAVEKDNDPDLLTPIWGELQKSVIKKLFQLITKQKSRKYISLFSKEISDPELFPEIISYYECFDDIEADSFKQLYNGAEEKDVKIEIIDLLARQNTVSSIIYKNERFMKFAEEFLGGSTANWEESIRRQFSWAEEKNELFTAITKAILISPLSIPVKIQKIAENCIREILKTASSLYISWKSRESSQQSSVLKLIDRIFEKEIKDLLKLTVCLAGLSISKQEHRFVLNDTIIELSHSITAVKGQILEIIGNYTSSEVNSFISTFIENLSPEEKCLRLKKFTKGFTLSFESLMDIWGDISFKADPNSKTGLRAEVIKYYKKEAATI